MAVVLLAAVFACEGGYMEPDTRPLGVALTRLPRTELPNVWGMSNEDLSLSGHFLTPCEPYDAQATATITGMRVRVVLQAAPGTACRADRAASFAYRALLDFPATRPPDFHHEFWTVVERPGASDSVQVQPVIYSPAPPPGHDDSLITFTGELTGIHGVVDPHLVIVYLDYSRGDASCAGLRGSVRTMGSAVAEDGRYVFTGRRPYYSDGPGTHCVGLYGIRNDRQEVLSMRRVPVDFTRPQDTVRINGGLTSGGSWERLWRP